MFCEYCGRDQSLNQCRHQFPLRTGERVLLLSILIFFSMAYYIILPEIMRPLKDGYMFYGYLGLLTSLTLYTLLGYLFKRPYLAFFFHCHQDKKKSLKWFKRLFPLCLRCLGILIGIFLTGLLIVSHFPWWGYLVLAIPLIIDGHYQQYTDYVSSPTKRLITGILFGPTVGFIYATTFYLMISLLHYFNPFV